LFDVVCGPLGLRINLGGLSVSLYAKVSTSGTTGSTGLFAMMSFTGNWGLTDCLDVFDFDAFDCLVAFFSFTI